MQFDPEETENPALIEKPKKDSKLKNKLKEMQEEAEKNKKEKVEWEVDQACLENRTEIRAMH